jgi:hypothetical protein
MTVSAVLPCLLFFLGYPQFVASYSFNIDTDLTSSNKIIYSTGDAAFGRVVDTNQDFNGDGVNDILANTPSSNAAKLILGGSTSQPFPLSISPDRVPPCFP